MKNCTSCGALIKGNSKVCPYCDSVLQDETTDEGTASETKASGYPMRWHKFMLVLLIIGAVVNVLTGVFFVAGEKVLTTRGLVDVTEYYSKYPGLKNSYWTSTVLSIAAGVFQVIVWKRLKEYRSNGPVSLKAMYVLAVVFRLIDLSCMSSAMNTNLFNTGNCLTVIAWVVLLIINSSYYAKRSELFVN